jgi:hypothetical protein
MFLHIFILRAKENEKKNLFKRAQRKKEIEYFKNHNRIPERVNNKTSH